MSLVIKLTSLLIFNVIQNLLNLITLFSIFGALPALPVKLRILFAEKKTLAVFGDQRAAVAIFAGHLAQKSNQGQLLPKLASSKSIMSSKTVQKNSFLSSKTIQECRENA